MTELLRNNQIALRTCILYEFIEDKPVYESFKNMCSKIGDDAIDYVDFEYWFMRFSNGKFDLNHNRSSNPKTRSLTDMPIHILEKIVNKLDLKYRFVIRRVSKNFQYIIDSWYPEFKTIRIEIDKNMTRLCFAGKEVAYNNNDEKRNHRYKPFKELNKTENACEVTYGNKKTLIKTEEHAKLAIEDLTVILKNPKLQLDELRARRCEIYVRAMKMRLCDF